MKDGIMDRQRKSKIESLEVKEWQNQQGRTKEGADGRDTKSDMLIDRKTEEFKLQEKRDIDASEKGEKRK